VWRDGGFLAKISRGGMQNWGNKTAPKRNEAARGFLTRRGVCGTTPKTWGGGTKKSQSKEAKKPGLWGGTVKGVVEKGGGKVNSESYYITNEKRRRGCRVRGNRRMKTGNMPGNGEAPNTSWWEKWLE